VEKIEPKAFTTLNMIFTPVVLKYMDV
jgi:hypothetical protein